jgi:hypothetical protein
MKSPKAISLSHAFQNTELPQFGRERRLRGTQERPQGRSRQSTQWRSSRHPYLSPRRSFTVWPSFHSSSWCVWICVASSGFESAGGCSPMKPKATIAHEQHRLKRPSVLADAEIAHLETVIYYFANVGAGDASEYFGPSYWLARIAGIGEQFHLVPAQHRRLTSLRTILVGAVPSKPAACSHKCRVCSQ